MQKSILWNGLDNDTEEHCAVNFLEDSIVVRSEIEGWAAMKPVYAEYVIKLGKDWAVQCFDITFHLSDEEHSYSMERDASGKWKDKSGKHYPEFDGCQYIDITLTPCTNSLPINGAGLSIGESREITVLYIDVLENRLYPDTQKYTNKGSNTWRFENGNGSFIADIQVDSDGFVTHYPGLFDMIKPS